MNEGYRRTEKPGEFFLVTHYLSRRLAYPLALLFRRLGLSANAVTVLGGLCWLASVPAAAAAGALARAGRPGGAWAALLAAAALWNAGYLLDVVDGSLARLTGTGGPAGFFLDFSFHLLFSPMFLCSLGVCFTLATGSPFFAALAVLSIGANWGVSFSAKEHVLCEALARRQYQPGRLTPQEEYELFIDSPRLKAPVAAKRRGRELWRRLVEEVFCFPGQFTLFSLVALADFLLRGRFGLQWPLLKTAFVVSAAVMLARVPFRLRREWRTLRRYEAAFGPLA